MHNLIGQTLDGKYRIEERLGGGGMGAVYLATHLGTHRTVALKVITPELMNNPEYVERFKREAEAAGRLRHPNIVDVTDFGFARCWDTQIAYLVMEYLDGCSLADVLTEEKHLPVLWVVEILEQVCSAMQEAHQNGIVHRDLKPDNIWLEPNRRGGYTVKVLDFGLAKPQDQITGNTVWKAGAIPAGGTVESGPEVLITGVGFPAAGFEFSEDTTKIIRLETESETRLHPPDGSSSPSLHSSSSSAFTQIGTRLGTPRYMSPEQCRGEAADLRSDIYSLGVIAFEMLAGVPPFQGETDALLRQHVESQPPPLRKLRAKVPRPLVRLIDSALAKNPADRPASAEVLGNALRAGVESSGSLIRQGISLYSEHFWLFLKIILLANLPLLLLGLLDFKVHSGTLSLSLLGVSTLGGLAVLNLIGWLMARFIPLLFMPTVIQLMAMPLRPVHFGTNFHLLRQRLGPLVWTLFVSSVQLVWRFLKLIIPGLLGLLYFSFVSPVVLIEGLSGTAALERSTVLVKRVWKLVIGILILTSIIEFLLTTPVSFYFATMIGKILHYEESDTLILKEFIFRMVYLVVQPIGLISMAMVYVRARQAGGEPLSRIFSELPEYKPQSGWQSRRQLRHGTRST
ncbi:MAG: serine/threonine protein kinase [Blastocatellia bacterium]|nr:serine/threonine protein kinase [Blastocatellia bacterium]